MGSTPAVPTPLLLQYSTGPLRFRPIISGQARDEPSRRTVEYGGGRKRRTEDSGQVISLEEIIPLLELPLAGAVSLFFRYGTGPYTTSSAHTTSAIDERDG